MKFSDYTADICGTQNLDEAKIEGDPKLFKAMETARENVRKFLENGGDKKSKEGMDLGAKLASAAVAYMESTLKRSKVNEAAISPAKSRKDVIKVLKNIESLINKNKVAFNNVMKEVFDDDSSDSVGAQLSNIIDLDISEIIDAIEDYE